MPQDVMPNTPSDSDDGAQPTAAASSSSHQQQHVQPTAAELTELESCLAEFAQYDADYIADWLHSDQ